VSPDLDTAVTVDLGPAPTAWSRGGCGPSRLRPLFARAFWPRWDATGCRRATPPRDERWSDLAGAAERSSAWNRLSTLAREPFPLTAAEAGELLASLQRRVRETEAEERAGCAMR